MALALFVNSVIDEIKILISIDILRGCNYNNLMFRDI